MHLFSSDNYCAPFVDKFSPLEKKFADALRKQGEKNMQEGLKTIISIDKHKNQMARQPSLALSPRNTEKREYQFYNTTTQQWQTCRIVWYQEQKKREAKTRFRPKGTERWFYSDEEFEEAKETKGENAKPGKKLKYGEVLVQLYVPKSFVAGIKEKMKKLKEKQK